MNSDKKQEKRPHPAGSCTCAGLWPVVTRTLSTMKFSDSFETHRWQPCMICSFDWEIKYALVTVTEDGSCQRKKIVFWLNNNRAFTGGCELRRDIVFNSIALIVCKLPCAPSAENYKGVM